jgi:TctA family transporter
VNIHVQAALITVLVVVFIFGFFWLMYITNGVFGLWVIGAACVAGVYAIAYNVVRDMRAEKRDDMVVWRD